MKLPSIEQIAIIADVDPKEIRSIYLIEEDMSLWFDDEGAPKDIQQFLWITGPKSIYPGILLRLDFLPHGKFICSTFRITPLPYEHIYHDLHQFLVDHCNMVNSITELTTGGIRYVIRSIYNQTIVGAK